MIAFIVSGLASSAAKDARAISVHPTIEQTTAVTLTNSFRRIMFHSPSLRYLRFFVVPAKAKMTLPARSRRVDRVELRDVIVAARHYPNEKTRPHLPLASGVSPGRARL